MRIKAKVSKRFPVFGSKLRCFFNRIFYVGMIELPRNTKVYSKINSADVYCIYTIYLSDFRQIIYTLRAFDKKSYEGTFVRTLVKASYGQAPRVPIGAKRAY